MAIEITRPGKYSLIVSTPVMPAAGTVGFGDRYKALLDYDKLGALVTNPVTIEPWSPASGTRIISLDAGVLVHTGLSNPGLVKAISQNRRVWAKMSIPVILHLVGTSASQIKQALDSIDEVDEIAAVELGLRDDISAAEASDLVEAASRMEKPLLARLPFYECHQLALPVAEAGADALVLTAAPRGTARDERTGRLVSGRVYGPLIKPIILRLVGRLRREIPDDVRIIASGGIHSPQDARDYIDAGAIAVQVDTATWAQPKMLERIARDLGGWIATRQKDALPDEWSPDMGHTEAIDRRPKQPAPKPDLK
jgi:dihydroorotate dehydrogenase (NAD+) catalytic subunit